MASLDLSCAPGSDEIEVGETQRGESWLQNDGRSCLRAAWRDCLTRDPAEKLGAAIIGFTTAKAHIPAISAQHAAVSYQDGCDRPGKHLLLHLRWIDVHCNPNGLVLTSIEWCRRLRSPMQAHRIQILRLVRLLARHERLPQKLSRRLRKAQSPD